MNKRTPLRGCGNLDTAYKIRQLMRRVINHQFKAEITPTQQSAINGSASIALKTLEVSAMEEKLVKLEGMLEQALKVTKSKGKKKKQ